MIIHTANVAGDAQETFSYYFSHATGNLLHFGSRANAQNSPSKFIEIIVDAERKAQEIDVILDNELPKAQAAVAHIPKRLDSGAFDLTAKNDHLEALCAHLGLDSEDESVLRQIHRSKDTHELKGFPMHIYTVNGKSYRVTNSHAPLVSRGVTQAMDNGNLYDIAVLKPSEPHRYNG